MHQSILDSFPFVVCAIDGDKLSYRNVAAQELAPAAKSFAGLVQALAIDDPKTLVSAVEQCASKNELILSRQEKAWAHVVLLPYEVEGENVVLLVLEPVHEGGDRVLAKVDGRRGEMLGIAAHDLRTPLHKLSLSLEMLENNDLPEQQREKFVQIMWRSIDSMHALINDILDVTKIDSGAIELHLERVPVQNFIDDVCEFNQYLAEKKEISLVVDVESAPEFAVFDPKRIRQVLNNLLSNAVKFSHPKSTIMLRVSSGEKKFVFSIADQGLGMSEEDLGNVFIPFGRFHNQPTGNEQSTGLGLAICKKIVDLHAGVIEVESEVGKGTTFTVQLPQE